jgi:3-isopropylmalate/(R)-2-methylmalate dehydratase small subunit
MAAIVSIFGRGLPLHGDDLDTDRIMPARFLRVVTFEGLEQHVFEDDRASMPDHPFNKPEYAGASILVVNSNFGCGSSREHAPQGLLRYGITAIVGESFSEIFLGNSSVLGIPCFTAEPAAVKRLQAAIEKNPQIEIEVNVETGVIAAETLGIEGHLPAGVRDSFLSDQWNPTSLLLDKYDEVGEVADRLPYVTGF